METVLAASDINFDPALVTDVGLLSAEEFLLYVRYEADQCPGVVRAPVNSAMFDKQQTQYMPKVAEIPTCKEEFLPSSEWENEVVESFSCFREHLSNMSKDLTTRERKYVVPSMKDESSWFRFCLGGSIDEADGSREKREVSKAKVIAAINDDIDLRKNMLLASLDADYLPDANDNVITVKGTNNEGEEGEIEETKEDQSFPQPEVIEYASAVPPSNQLLLQLDQVLTQRLLSFFANWLKFPSFSTNLLSTTTNISAALSWVFSLLSRLEKPLYRDASATVRDIYRQLCILRMDLAERVPSLHEAETETETVTTSETRSQVGGPICPGASGPTKRRREHSADSGDSITDVSQLSARVQETLAVLNTVIVISGKYFGQEENICVRKEEVSSAMTADVAAPVASDLVTRGSAKYTTLVPDEDLYGGACRSDDRGADSYNLDDVGEGDY